MSLFFFFCLSFFLCFSKKSFSFFFLNKINMLGFLTLAMVKGGSTCDAFTQKVALSGGPTFFLVFFSFLYLRFLFQFLSMFSFFCLCFPFSIFFLYFPFVFLLRKKFLPFSFCFSFFFSRVLKICGGTPGFLGEKCTF